MGAGEGRRHIASLDGLRGIAVALVIGYHMLPHRGLGPIGALFTLGWAGVDLFFSLSGFLITGILHDALGEPGYYRSFYARRALRLFPLYFLFVGVTLVLAGGTDGHSWGVTLTYLLYASNAVRFFEPGLKSFGPVETGHLWSLALEEQFYLLWPAAVALLGTRRRILAASLLGSLAAMGLRLWVSGTEAPDLTCYLQLPTRLDALLLGSAVAMLLRAPGADPHRWRKEAWFALCVSGGLLALMGLRVGTFYFGTAPIRTWGLACTSVGGAALLLLALTKGSVVERICRTSVLRKLGYYSYGLYLLHYAPVAPYKAWQSELIERLDSVWLGCLASFVPFMLGLVLVEWLLFQAVERPFLNLKRYFPYTEKAAARVRT